MAPATSHAASVGAAIAGTPDSRFGAAVAGARDITLDGISDVLVGAPSAGSQEQGAVSLFSGADHDINATPVWTATGDQANAHFGAAIAAGADIDGDGYMDVVVGAPDYDVPSTDAGRVYVYMGRPSGGLPTSPNRILSVNQAGARFGSSIALVDVNNDGLADVLVGAPGASNGHASEGLAYLFLGSSGGISTSPSWTTESNLAGAKYGAAVTGAGDLNGDGFGDVAVGAPYAVGTGCFVCQEVGRAFVYFGGASGLGTTPTVLNTTGLIKAVGHFGASLAGVGDFNGDGFDDLVVAAPDILGAGVVRLFLGKATGIETSARSYTGPAPSRLGASLAPAGDWNSDGYADFVAGAPVYMAVGMPMGNLYIFHGTATLDAKSLSDPTEFAAWQFGMNFGAAVAPGYDANSSCVSDVLVSTSTDHVALIDGDDPCPSACETHPPAVALTSPSDAATGQPTTITMNWAPVEGATAYRLAIRCPTGESPLTSKFENVTSTSFTCDLLPDAYTWFVQARNTCGRLGPRSPEWSFTVGAGSNCRAITLSSPEDGINCAPTSGTLAWEPLPAATGYEVQIARRPGHPDIVAHVTQPTYDYSDLREGRRYYWRVREECTCSSFSEWASFETIDRPPARPKPIPANTHDAPATGTLSWRPVRDAVGYRVQLGTACGNGAELDVSETSMTYGPLASGTTYFWRVAARDSCGAVSAYQECKSFSTAGVTGVNRYFIAQGLPLMLGAQSAVLEIDAENSDALERIHLVWEHDSDDLITVVGWTTVGTRSEGAQVNVSIPHGRVDMHIDYLCATPLMGGAGPIIRLLVDVAPTAPIGTLQTEFEHGEFRRCTGQNIHLDHVPDSIRIGGPPEIATTDNIVTDEPMGFFDATSNSNLALEFTSTAGEGQVAVERFEETPENLAFVGGTPASTFPTRWVIEQQDLGAFEANVYFSLHGIASSPGQGPNVRIYRRESPGVGAFQIVPTTYDPTLNMVSSTVTGFSEFILATWPVTGVMDRPQADVIALRSLSPNPCRGRLSFEVTLSSAEEAQLELFDVLGRRRERIDLKSAPSGRYVVELPGSKSLESGIYFARLTQGRFEHFARVVMLH